ncbi:MAG: M13 family metallopeptidase [Bacteroidota bacterium]
MTRFFSLLMLSALLVWSCGETDTPNADNPEAESPGLRLGNMDTTVSPREDFFHYTNGGYIAQNEIPPEESSWGVFQELRDGNDFRVREIMEACRTAGGEKGSIEQMVGDYYQAAMDTAAIEAAGLSGIEPLLAEVDAIANTEDLIAVLAKFHRQGISGGFTFWIDQDDKNSQAMVAKLYQGGMGLPDRAYYLDDNPRYQTLRTAYEEYIAEVHRLTGAEEAAAAESAATVMKMETALAQSAMGIVERRDPDKTYNRMDLMGLETVAPGLDWRAYFSGIGLAEPGDFVVGQPKFFMNFADMTATYSLDEWKTYIRWSLLRSLASDLNRELVMADFEFYGKQLNGAEQIRPRWKRVVSGANRALGMAIGKKYVDQHFSPTAKKIALEMVDNILAEMTERLGQLEWMGEETREKAIYKVSTITPKIGYPDKWRDYTGLEITDNYLQNVLNARAFNFQYRIDKVGKPVDKTEWGLPPQIVNAFYNPSMNEIVFPAGILQAPFFDERVDLALNYGGFGAVIGHELIHAFDDQGSKFDADGNLNNWWTEEDRKNFEARTQLVVDQYNAYKVLDSLPINGRLTLGENIADIDGLRISFYAWKRSQTGKEAPASGDGFTPEQRFFINYGQIWSSKMRDQYLQNMIATNPHSPAQYRVIGSTSNLPEFYAAFNVQPGDPMYRPDSLRVVIW